DSEVMPYLDAAYDCFVRYGDKSLADLTLYTKASQYSILHMHKEADSLFTKVIADGNIPDSSFPDVLANYALALIGASSDDSKKIEELFSKAIDLGEGLRSNTFWGAYAYILAVNGKRDLSESIFRQLGDDDGFWESRAYAATHDYKSAYHSLKRSLYVQDSIISVKLQNSSAKAQRDYFSLQERASRSRLRGNRLLFALIITLILMAAIVLYYFFLKWRAAVQKEKSDLMSMSEMVKHQLEEVQAHSSTERLLYDRELRERDAMLSRMKSGYVQSYRRQFRYLGILSETFLTSEARRDSYKVICEKVRTVVGGMNLDVTRHSDFESMLNAGLDDVMKHVHSDFPSLSEDEYRFISYVIAGFDATTICVILNMPSQASVYMKKSRMKKLLLSSTSEYREQYVELFG
ncbi:MAG: hypothetical protein K2H10_02175, partial [Bacteroidales bacterium]|nr:hypothetical protein [Bacteroidales bacterium]